VTEQGAAIATDAVKVAPAATYAASYMGGAEWTVSELAALAALVYSCLMIIDFCSKKIRAWRRGRLADQSAE
jgi:hypothetical protein